MNTGHPFTFATADLTALPTGALWWDDHKLLVVSDLHLGKSDRIARRTGTMVPPYETHDTLMRLETDIMVMGAKQVICLGDSFDDMAASANLDAKDRDWILTLQAGRDWTWIEGNHDPAPLTLGGQHKADTKIGPLTFRHIAQPDADGEVSGHYHPKLRLPVRGKVISRPCFLFDDQRLMLPAYGTYTGGLCLSTPVLQDLMGPKAELILAGKSQHRLPMPRGAKSAAI
ncbi:MAG: ligase-associated DNA damage response endonuclease PdeM [Pseudomonadota bacterium]